jgi:diaminopimelate decarboxylase
MTGFCRDAQGHALLGGTSIAELLDAADTTTPAFVYDLDAMASEVRSIVAAFGKAPHLVAYAMKANSAGSVLRAVAAAGAGVDVVSGGELAGALPCGIAPGKIVMSGVAKRDDEIDQALERGIFALQLESIEEIGRVAERATALNRSARVSFRVNPGVAIDSHAHVATGHDEAKFGIAQADIQSAFAAADARSAIAVVGLSTHIGSTQSETARYSDAAAAVCAAARARAAAGRPLEFLDFGGGFGIDYGGMPAAPPKAFVAAALAEVERARLTVTVVVEPGRAIVGPHGVLVARVIQRKTLRGRRWLFVDAAMNDLIRPALYGARHRIEPLEAPPTEPTWHVAGPVCESADVFGEFALGDPPPERVVIRDVGAYSFVMASQYNGRALASEVFVSGGRVASVSPASSLEQWLDARSGA